MAAMTRAWRAAFLPRPWDICCGILFVSIARTAGRRTKEMARSVQQVVAGTPHDTVDGDVTHYRG